MARKEKVTRIIDGDTFETASRKHPIRLANLDAPERGKPGYAKATRDLSALIKGETVTVDTVARDTYGRSVANVKVGRKSVNNAMRTTLKKPKAKR